MADCVGHLRALSPDSGGCPRPCVQSRLSWDHVAAWPGTAWPGAVSDMHLAQFRLLMKPLAPGKGLDPVWHLRQAARFQVVPTYVIQDKCQKCKLKNDLLLMAFCFKTRVVKSTSLPRTRLCSLLYNQAQQSHRAGAVITLIHKWANGAYKNFIIAPQAIHLRRSSWTQP